MVSGVRVGTYNDPLIAIQFLLGRLFGPIGFWLGFLAGRGGALASEGTSTVTSSRYGGVCA